MIKVQPFMDEVNKCMAYANKLLEGHFHSFKLEITRARLNRHTMFKKVLFTITGNS